MSIETSRRNFLKLSVAGTAVAGALSCLFDAAGQPGGGKVGREKGVGYKMPTQEVSVAGRVKVAREKRVQVVVGAGP